MNPCGAKTRAGHPCRHPGYGQGGRCHYHGGTTAPVGSVNWHRMQNGALKSGRRSREGQALERAMYAWRVALQAVNEEPENQDRWRRLLWALTQREAAQAALDARRAQAAQAMAPRPPVAEEPAVCAQLPQDQTPEDADGSEAQATKNP